MADAPALNKLSHSLIVTIDFYIEVFILLKVNASATTFWRQPLGVQIGLGNLLPSKKGCPPIEGQNWLGDLHCTSKAMFYKLPAKK